MGVFTPSTPSPCERMSVMANDQYPNRPSTYGDLFDRLDRIEDKLDRRLDSVDRKVEGVTSRLDRMEGALGMLRWLGPTGVVAVIFALAQSVGLIS